MYKKHIGIILKKHPFGEADELLTVFTRDSGKLRFKTRSTRKVKSRLAGSLQTLNEVEFETARSSRGASTGNRLPLIISVRLKRLNGYLREDLRRFALAQVGAETLYRLSPDAEEGRSVYERFAEFLTAIGQNLSNQELRYLLRSFQLDLLALYGYENKHLTPDLDEEIERFIEYVLEREIKSQNFLSSVSNS